MENTTNLIEKMVKMTESENKRREQAIKYLEKLTEILAPQFEEIIGATYHNANEVNALWIPIYDKNKEKYNVDNATLYFRYKTYYGRDEYNDREYVGFYKSDGYIYWGKDLTEIKGTEFWLYVKQITDWLVNYVPQWLDGIEKSRQQRYEQLDKIMKALSQVE